MQYIYAQPEEQVKELCKSLGVADRFLDKGAFSHGTSRGFLSGRPNFQGMLWGLPPIFQRGTVLAQAAGNSPPLILGGDPCATCSFILASQGA